MDIASLGSKWILGCATVGAFALVATQAGAAPKKDPETRRAAVSERRVDAVGRSMLRLSMVDEFPTGRDAFLPRGQEIARANRDDRGNREGRDSRGAAQPSGRADVDLFGIPRPRGGEGAPSVNPIPEPTSLILLAAGAGLVAYAARRKLLA